MSAVPKKSKLYGWECAKCVRKKDSDYEEGEDEKITADQNNDEEDLYNKLEISRLSKARKIKLDKIKNNPDLDEGTKEQMMNLI